ncbi:MAG TPA: hypothetical protein VFS94_09745 [Gemmatimonadales bacterium]|nr:hypothetical protein [Gemmatimonadales bacterium]
MIPSTAIAAVTVAALIASPSGAAETLRYRIQQQIDQVVDLSAMGQAEQVLSAAYDLYLTLEVTDSAGGRAVRATVDSVVPGPGADNPALAAMIGGFKDLRGAGFVTAEGEAEGFVDVDSVRGPQLRGLVDGLFPMVKPGTKAGDSWSDTVSTTDTIPTGITSRSAVTNHMAAAGDGGALKITSKSAYSLSGTVQGGLPLEGRGNSTAEVHVAPGGWVLSGKSDDQSDLLLAPPGAGVIPIANQVSGTITMLQ